MDDDSRSLSELASLCVRLAVDAGRLITEQRPPHLTVDTKTSRTDVVTEMDRRAEEQIRAAIRRARPGDALQGEEGRDETGSTGLTWVIDPIDGTVNYLYGIPAYAVSVAVATGDPHTPGGWSVLAGAIADPERGAVFHARRGGGAFERDRLGRDHRLTVTDEDDLGLALIGTGFGYLRERRIGQAAVVAALLPQVRDIRRAGSAALDLAAVAAGRLDGFYELGLHPWDLAAGWLLVTEAGGVVSGPDGSSSIPGMTIAAGRQIHRLLESELAAPA